MKIEELRDNSQGSENASPLAITDYPLPEIDPLTKAMNNQSLRTPTPPPRAEPALPPAMESIRKKTTEEILADLNKSPLFMTDLEANDDIEALKALAYEGTPAEVAQGFKERGNESFKEKAWKDAKEFYGKGIQVLLLEVRKRQSSRTKAKKKKSEVKLELAILEACLVNRAACHLELKNYRSCTFDCAAALKINNRNLKAYYRSTKAFLKLGKVREADDVCAHGLQLDTRNPELLALAAEITKRTVEERARIKKETERLERKKLEGDTLRAALRARGIHVWTTDQPPDMEDAKIQLVPDPTDPTSTLSFPTVLLYPLHLESDFIKAFNETEPLEHHLEYILPLPWDKEGLYTLVGVECYMETMTGGLVKVGKKAPLLKVLGSGKIEVVDELVKIFVVPKASADEWVQDFKAKKAAENSND